jgi:hypothetical protein
MTRMTRMTTMMRSKMRCSFDDVRWARKCCRMARIARLDGNREAALFWLDMAAHFRGIIQRGV